MRSRGVEAWSENYRLESSYVPLRLQARDVMRVVECNICGETLAAATDHELERRLRNHVESEHPSASVDEAQARELVSSEAYDASDS
jgi:predicted small metal-binding protein